MNIKHVFRFAAVCAGSFLLSTTLLAHRGDSGRVTRHVGNFTITLAGAANLAPHVVPATQSTAVSKALSEMATVNSAVSGYTVSLAVLEPTAVAAVSSDLNVTLAWAIPHAVWLIELTAPPQGGWASQWAVVAVDASTSQVLNSVWGGCAASVC
jgi:hypothetical protein